MLRRLSETAHRPVAALHCHPLHRCCGLGLRNRNMPTLALRLIRSWPRIALARNLRIFERVIRLAPACNVTAHVIANRHHRPRALLSHASTGVAGRHAVDVRITTEFTPGVTRRAPCNVSNLRSDRLDLFFCRPAFRPTTSVTRRPTDPAASSFFFSPV